MKFELTPEEHALLILALGIAAGASSLALAERIFRLTNSIQKDNPRWTPLKVGE